MKKDKSIVKDGTSPIELSADQLSKIESDYNDSSVRHQALLEEVVFILSEKLKSRELKIHAIEKRVKELSSVIGKCKRENIGDFAELRDVVGARVICLFRLDMDDVGKLITENFDVVEVDDKLSIDNNPLGYLSDVRARAGAYRGRLAVVSAADLGCRSRCRSGRGLWLPHAGGAPNAGPRASGLPAWTPASVGWVKARNAVRICRHARQ